ncbi:MAG TPA: alpha-2-macroglobulin family protein, partial [Candidatus Anammoximicrobium sp.]|nr:alpha-2-macroglobulin family protein [Candidatus Anammoximicrobium sp.]
MLFALLLALPAWAGVRDEQWKKVDEAIAKGLPKTAVEQLEPIIAGAMKDKAYAEAVKAIAKKIALEGSIQGNKPEEKITRMKAEIAKAPPQMAPVMEAILANWYWHYFQQNRWRFLQRTATAQAPGDDFTTWDLPRILAEIDKQFTKALAGEAVLKATPVTAYDDLLQKGSVPDSYRPTMFDFLAHNALEFYNAGEQAGAKAEDAFDLMADSPIFATAEEFIAWEIQTSDENSATLKAIRLYQNLLKFHQADEDKTALIDADLLRLNFGWNKAFGEEKNARYKAALKRFTDKWGDHEIAARALHDWATVLQQEGDLVEAHRLAERGKNAFPNSVGGRRCHNLLLQIEAKSSQIHIERVWNQPLSKIQVRYRNLTKVFFRVVAESYDARLKTARYRPEQLDDNERRALLAKTPVRQWSADLPPTADYQERTEEVEPPADLKPGFYFLVASHDPGFGEQNNLVSFTDFWVSDLALIVRTRGGKANVEGFVLNAISGEPVAGAEVQAWYHTRNNVRQAGPMAKTDQQGLFSLATGANQRMLLVARHAGQMLATANDYSAYQRDQDTRPITRTVLFTDRSLYRPGQTIHYKGICLDIDQEQDNYKTIANRVVNVIFADRNNKEVARQQHQTNDYGSFSGSFTAPRDRVTGRMSIRVDGEPAGQTAFNVEEYKRPKFQVAVDRPEVAPKLNGEAAVRGRATAYTGAAVNGAKVRYRVVRQVRYPVWWGWHYWWRMPPAGGGQEITHGRATTDADGSFEIKFVARPDLSVPEKDEPVFEYTVYADVTDTTGETRSGQQTIRVGYTALQATLAANDWQTVDKPVQVTIKTATLDGEGQLAEGSLKIYRLKAPDKVQRVDLGGQPYPRPAFRGGVTAATEPKPNPSDPNSWPLGEVVAEHGWTTDAEGNATFSCPLAAGAYRAVLETQDRFNKRVTAQQPLRVVDPAAKQFAVKIPYSLLAPAWTLEPGQEFLALWGTGYDKARAYVEIEHRRKIVKSFWTAADVTQAAVKQEVTEALRGGFTLHVTMVRENRAYTTSQKVTVPWTNQKLNVAWEHFVSKLEPAQKETWTLIVGPSLREGKRDSRSKSPTMREGGIDSRSESPTMKAVAEMVAALYDASLDAYLPHNWPQGFGVFREDYSLISSRFENMLKGLQHMRGGWPQQYQDPTMSYRSFPVDIIANFWGFEFFGRNRRGASLGFGGGGMGGMMAPAAAAPGAPPRALQALNMDRLANGQAEMATAAADESVALFAKGAADAVEKQQAGAGEAEAAAPDLSKVSARQNLNETAFFFPHLIADADGRVKLEFTMPEALTEWKFLGFAHDASLRSGLLQDKVVTAKDLMVQPNPPRFLREGDVLEFTVKVSNQSPTRQTGAVRLTLADARTGKPMDAALGNTATDQPFDIPSKESQSLSWRLTVPDGSGFLTYKAVGSTGKLSDGEEGFLPVLSRRILVTESLPLPVRGAQTKKFEFTKLMESGKSDTLRHQSVTVQMVSNPSWYAVMALPYLMEFPHECTEQTFNRLYANALARHIANSDPKIRRVFDQWKGTPALD